MTIDVNVVERESLKVGKEPVVVLPLKRWQAIEEAMDEWECFARYNEAISDPKNKKLTSFEEVNKKFNLP
jgi:hypothetical protein